MNPFSNLPAPVPDRDSAPFWEACADRRLLVRSCSDCGRGHYPPGPICPWCGSFSVSWVEAQGLGHVRSFVVMHHPFLPDLADAVPYCVVKVALDDHPDAVLHGRLSGSDIADVAVGSPVRVVWDEVDEGAVVPNWEIAG